MHLYTETFSTPFELFSIAVTPHGAVAATAFGDEAALRRRLPRSTQCHTIRDASATAAVRQQLLEFFSGQRTRFDLRIEPHGTEFQRRVWEALQAIPFGQTRSYGALAAQLGAASAARAVGRANATNPVCVMIPCHRVVGSDGSLTGFAFGEDIKRRLLALEQATLRQAA